MDLVDHSGGVTIRDVDHAWTSNLADIKTAWAECVAVSVSGYLPRCWAWILPMVPNSSMTNSNATVLITSSHSPVVVGAARTTMSILNRETGRRTTNCRLLPLSHRRASGTAQPPLCSLSLLPQFLPARYEASREAVSAARLRESAIPLRPLTPGSWLAHKSQMRRIPPARGLRISRLCGSPPTDQ